MKISLSLALLLIPFSGATAGAAEPHEGAKWGHADASVAAVLTETRGTKHFDFRFAGDETGLKDLFSCMEGAYKRVSKVLAPLPARLRVEIYPDINLYHKRTFGENSAGWMVGNFDPDENVIRMTSPASPGPYHTPGDMLVTAAHEFTHAMTFHFRGGTREGLPVWLDEGVAIYYSGQLDERARKRVRKALAENKVPDIAQLQENFMIYDGYTFAGTIVEFIADEYGAKKLREFIMDPAGQERIFGLSPAALNAAWRKRLAAKYGNKP